MWLVLLLEKDLRESWEFITMWSFLLCYRRCHSHSKASLVLPCLNGVTLSQQASSVYGSKHFRPSSESSHFILPWIKSTQKKQKGIRARDPGSISSCLLSSASPSLLYPLPPSMPSLRTDWKSRDPRHACSQDSAQLNVPHSAVLLFQTVIFLSWIWAAQCPQSKCLPDLQPESQPIVMMAAIFMHRAWNWNPLSLQKGKSQNNGCRKKLFTVW